MLERPLELIESVKRTEEAFDRIGGGRSPGRADGRQELGELGHQSRHHRLSGVAVGLSEELGQAPPDGALADGVKEALELSRHRLTEEAGGDLGPQSTKRGAQGMEVA